MAAPAVVTLASCPVSYSILYAEPATLNGENGSGWESSYCFKVAYSDMDAFCTFAGGSKVTYTSGGNTFTRIIPLSDPDRVRLLCRKIEAKATGGWTPGNSAATRNWSHARVKLTFNSVPYLTDGSTPFMDVQTHAGAEAYTLAGTRLAFSDATPIQADAALIVPTMTYAATIYQAPALADDVVRSLLGQCNSVALTLKTGACAIGTVRFDGMDSRLTMTADFQQAYMRTLVFTWRPVPWNQFLRPNGVWDTAYGPSSATVYGLSDLTPLIS